jgi:rubrerythrin
MEYKKPFDSFAQSAHDKAQAAVDHATEIRIGAAEGLRKKHAEKTSREPHLIADGNLQRCSVCGYPFEADVHPSMGVAFAEQGAVLEAAY